MSSSFKDRLERLHGSRERAEQRAERERDHGIFSADDAVEHDHPPGEAPPDDPPPPAKSEPGGGKTLPRTHEDPNRAEECDGRDDGAPLSKMTYRRADSAASEPNEGDDTTPTDPPDTEVGERLARSYSLRNRSDRGRSADRTSAGDDVSRETESGPTDDGRTLSPNERAEMLRNRAADHIDAGDWNAAVPILHEILALLPRHTFALEKLTNYHRNEGDTRLADHYESRLRDVAPF